MVKQVKKYLDIMLGRNNNIIPIVKTEIQSSAVRNYINIINKY